MRMRFSLKSDMPLMFFRIMKIKKSAMSAVDTVFLVVLAVTVVSFGICIFALPRVDFSIEENRVLAPAPRFSLERLIDGRFFGDISDFYSDRIPLRTFMIRVKAVCELALCRSENNGVLFLEGGRLCDRCEYESLDALEKNISLLSELSEQGRTEYFFVPRSVDVYFGGEESERVRSLAYGALGGEDLYNELYACAIRGDSTYYKTDHHLDSDGAYVLYRQIVEKMGDTAYEQSDFDVRTVSDSFLGSAYSACGLLPVSRDTVELYRYDGDTELDVRCEDAGCGICELYCFDQLYEKDKYRVFLGGNHGVLNIEAVGGGRERLLIIKDSFANAVIPLLARHYDLTVIDPRYAEICIPEGISATVVIVGIDTLAYFSF